MRRAHPPLNLREKNNNLKLGFLDITFFRDDFRRSEKVLQASVTEIDFTIENMTVVLVDDVLFTGRSIRAALNAIQIAEYLIDKKFLTDMS